MTSVRSLVPIAFSSCLALLNRGARSAKYARVVGGSVQ